MSRSGLIAIITNRFDLTADLGILAIQDLGYAYARINTEDCMPIISDFGSREVLIETPERGVINASDFRSIWLRRPRYIPDGVEDNNPYRTFINDEVKSLWKNVYQELSDKYWINFPVDNERARNRIWVLEQARLAGLRTPPTLATRKRESLVEFMKAVGPIALKSIGRGFKDADRGVAAFTTVMTEVEEVPESIGPTPVLAQKYIEKVSDWRVTVVGDYLYPVRLLSQDIPSASVDWRKSESLVPMEPAQLTGDTVASIRLLMERLNLVFGAIDFVENQNGDLVFLEINSNGQWGWIQQQIGVPIASGLAKTLNAAGKKSY